MKHEYRRRKHIEIPQTISCIELTMRHDKRGYLVGWMQGEPRTNNWNGSSDNQGKTLENHISKHGWQF